ncbi:S-layer homology domain-containing protein [Lysinibacillus fusiformis]|uniref:YcdB/YcdC domain-containing protein n=1 Tax=Lysinibacillus fusiformis TaxID=28031 RepID=UPI00196717B4|nr:YcdB/YcdC domain-containing protein [Lysinibacillus fusiformis]QSB11167.1 S-layer homology domain-containing protein [Lysinibacillus fusiformis]
MGKFKKLGIILTTTAFSVGVLAPVSQASANVKEPSERIEIQLAATETKVTKGMLINKLRALFPEEFKFVADNEFNSGGGHFFRDDKTVRYDLNFHKTVNGKDVYGGFTFKGEDLDLEHFYYQPANIAEAVYPAKYSEIEAKKIAEDFLKKFANLENYKLREDGFGYYNDINRPLSQPITYSFVYSPTYNGVLIGDQSITIDVLANGQITGMYRNTDSISKATFDSSSQKKNEEEIAAQVRDNLAVELRYAVDYSNDQRNVKLVYMPATGFNGVHALTGQWQTTNGFSAQVPKTKSAQKISSQQLPPRKSGMTVAEVEEFAKNFLKVDEDKATLSIDMVDERENESGETVYTVNYMYMYNNGGSGTSFEINKATGEIVQYHDLRRDFTNTDKTNTISKDAALAKAVEYLKQWAPSYLHEYSMPIDDAVHDDYSKDYYFSFPRIVNGIAVVGDEIYVGIGSDGSLRSLNVNKQKINNWPSISQVISADKAKEAYSKALTLQLQYAKQDTEGKQHYDLIYAPTYNGSLDNQIDAITGEWLYQVDGSKEKPSISHPTAANELNYLLNQNVLEVKDIANFNADAAVTKGEALKILLKSLTYGYFGSGEGEKQSFSNIDKNHPLYGVVEQAVRMGILQPANQFALDETLTRQELAVWAVKVMQLENVAKYKDIYKLNFADAASIDPAYTGYIAIANGMGLIDTQQNNFNATKSVSYADLAVSTVRLAKAIQENKVDRNFYY